MKRVARYKISINSQLIDRMFLHAIAALTCLTISVEA